MCTDVNTFLTIIVRAQRYPESFAGNSDTDPNLIDTRKIDDDDDDWRTHTAKEEEGEGVRVASRRPKKEFTSAVYVLAFSPRDTVAYITSQIGCANPTTLSCLLQLLNVALSNRRFTRHRRHEDGNNRIGISISTYYVPLSYGFPIVFAPRASFVDWLDGFARLNTRPCQVRFFALR